MKTVEQERLEVAHCLPPTTPWYLWLSVAVLGTAAFGYWVFAAGQHPNTHLRTLQDPLLLPGIFIFLAALVVVCHQFGAMRGFRVQASPTDAGSLGERAYRIAERISAGGLGPADRKHSQAALQTTANDLNQEFGERLFYVSASAILVLLASVLVFGWRTIDHKELVPTNYQPLLLCGAVLGSLLYVPATFLSAYGRHFIRRWHNEAFQHAGLQHVAIPTIPEEQKQRQIEDEPSDPFASVPHVNQADSLPQEADDDQSSPFPDSRAARQEEASPAIDQQHAAWEKEENNWDGFGAEETDPFKQFGN